jgi:aspartyl protease family protein
MSTPQEPNQNDSSQVIGKNMMIIAWIFAIALLTYFFGMFEDKQLNPNDSPSSYRSQNAIEVTLDRNKYGHYMVSGSVNQREVLFMLDTGATVVAVPGELQQELGLISGNMHYSHTANGKAKAYDTIIRSLEIGDIMLRDVRASIIPNMQGREILLGMSVLKQLEFTQKGKQLTLRQIQ